MKVIIKMIIQTYTQIYPFAHVYNYSNNTRRTVAVAAWRERLWIL